MFIMKALVLFDSQFGNTKIIAQIIAKELGKNVKAVSVSGFNIKSLKETNLLVVGSPIHGWRPSEKMVEFLAKLEKGQLEGVQAAAFDTRVKVFFHGDASKKIAKKLKQAGASIIVNPEVFFVEGTNGPLLKGEIEKARVWAKSIKLRAV